MTVRFYRTTWADIIGGEGVREELTWPEVEATLQDIMNEADALRKECYERDARESGLDESDNDD